MIRAVFFDLGNTIVDYHTGGIDDHEKDMLGLLRMRDHLARGGVRISFDDLVRVFYVPWMDAMTRRAQSATEFDIRDFLRDLNLPAHIDFESLIREFHEPAARFAVENGDIRDCLRTLRDRNIRLGVISNSPVPGVCHLDTLSRLDLARFFDGFIFSYDAGFRKPSREIFTLALESFGVPASDCVMVGDKYLLDIETPSAMGIRSFLYDSASRPVAQCPTITCFSELPLLLES